jgi:hypothetical protein
VWPLRDHAKGRAPTLIGRFEAVAAGKATEALFAQLAGGGAAPVAKVRSKEVVTKQRAFNNIGHSHLKARPQSAFR